MRPIRLVVEGFTAFRDTAEVDFSGVDFFALVGPTGSGKSSVLDAIGFALYGAVPRYSDDRLVAPAITQGSNEARVSLTFEVDSEEYTATRIVRRTASGGATTKEARLEHGDDVLAGNAKEVTEEATRLIGLSFHDFTRCVALPQGEFASFLHDKPSDRQDLVVKLLDLGVYERMQQRAHAIGAEGKGAIVLADQRLNALADCTPDAEAAIQLDLSAVKEVRVQLTTATPHIEQLDRDLKKAESEAESASTILIALAAVKVPQPVRALGQKKAAKVKEFQDAERERTRLEREATKAAKAIEGLPDVGTLEAALDAHDELAGLREEMATFDVALGQAAGALAKANAEHDTAEHALAHAQVTHDAALENSAASALAHALVAGEPCPVCAQVVQRLPKRETNSASNAKKALEQSRKAEALARKKFDTSSKKHAELVTGRRHGTTRIAALEKKIAPSGTRPQVEKRLSEVQTKRATSDAAQRVFAAADAAERKIRSRITEIDERLAAARDDFQAQRDALVSGGLEPPPASRDLVIDWDGLATWSDGQVPTQRERQRAAAKRAAEHLASAKMLVVKLAKCATDAGVELSGHLDISIGVLREAAAEAEANAKHELDRIVKGRKEATKLEKEIAATRTQVEVAEELARLLRSTNFEQWLVNEALERLVIGASDTLESLSSNQYGLAVNDKNEFEVIDHRNADEHRPAKTLSGGETFQASLALALALAEQLSGLAAHGGAKLDAIFLDEGFGTLDQDSLETVAGTLETLGGDGRMVGIITHVRELAERVPTRFEVTIGPRTSQITRVDA